MFTKIIELKATKQEFVFSYGMKEARFRPVVYLSADRRVMAIGDAPTAELAAREAQVFTDRRLEDAFALLEVLLRHGLRQLIGGGFFVGTLTLRVSLGADIREEVAGFAPVVFHYAAINSGVKRVVIE